MANTHEEEQLAAMSALRAAVMFLIARSAAGPDGSNELFDRRVRAMRDSAVRALSSAPGNKTSPKLQRINKRAEEHLRLLFDGITIGPDPGTPTSDAPPLTS